MLDLSFESIQDLFIEILTFNFEQLEDKSELDFSDDDDWDFLFSDLRSFIDSGKLAYFSTYCISKEQLALTDADDETDFFAVCNKLPARFEPLPVLF